MLASLDLIWLDDDYRVVEIAADQKPCVDGEVCPSIGPMKSARYVLEIAGGAAAGQDLEAGDRLIILQGPN